MNEAGIYDAAGNSYLGADVAQIDRHIEGSFVDAWRRCAKVMPRTWLGNKKLFTEGKILSVTDFNYTGFKDATIGMLITIPNANGIDAVVRVVAVEGTTPDRVPAVVEVVTPGAGFTAGQTITIPAKSPYASGTLVIETVGSYLTPNLSDGTGMVSIPDDFYLLTRFKMAGWKKSVFEVALDNERVSSIQSNEFTRGSSIRPVCVIDNAVAADGLTIEPVLKYYSLQKGLASHTVEEAIYVPTVESLSDKADDYELAIDSRIIEPLAYLSASTVFTIFEKYEVSKALDARAEAMFPGLISAKGTNHTAKQ